MTKYIGEPLNIIHTIGMQNLYPTIRIHFTVTNCFNLQRFKKAIKACTQVVPELLCKYVLTDNSFVTVTESLDQVVFTVLDPDKASADWDLFHDPQMRVYLNTKKAGTEVTIFLSHILTDGAGAKQLLYLLAGAYNGESLDNVHNHQGIDWLRQLLEKHSVDAYPGVDHPTAPLAMPLLANHDHRQRLTHTLALSNSLTKQLVKASHNTDVTLNDLFMAAFGRAVQRFSMSPRVSLACPTDMRKFIPGPPQVRIANHTARYNFDVAANPSSSFTEIVRTVHQAMQDNKARYQCLSSVKALVNNYDQYSLAKLQQICEDNYHVRAISYTNFGIIDQQKFHFAGGSVKEFNMLGSYRRAPMFQVAVSTYNGQITFSYAMIGNHHEACLGDAVMLTMRDLLTCYAGEFNSD